MPALAKQALSENGISPRPSANGKSSGAKKGDAADAWSEGQEAAFVEVSVLSYATFFIEPTSPLPCYQLVKEEYAPSEGFGSEA